MDKSELQQASGELLVEVVQTVAALLQSENEAVQVQACKTALRLVELYPPDFGKSELMEFFDSLAV